MYSPDLTYSSMYASPSVCSPFGCSHSFTCNTRVLCINFTINSRQLIANITTNNLEISCATCIWDGDAFKLRSNSSTFWFKYIAGCLLGTPKLFRFAQKRVYSASVWGLLRLQLRQWAERDKAQCNTCSRIFCLTKLPFDLVYSMYTYNFLFASASFIMLQVTRLVVKLSLIVCQFSTTYAYNSRS